MTWRKLQVQEYDLFIKFCFYEFNHYSPQDQLNSFHTRALTGANITDTVCLVLRWNWNLWNTMRKNLILRVWQSSVKPIATLQHLWSYVTTPTGIQLLTCLFARELRAGWNLIQHHNTIDTLRKPGILDTEVTSYHKVNHNSDLSIWRRRHRQFRSKLGEMKYLEVGN